MNKNGSSIVEFVLVLPWLVGCFLAVVLVAIWVSGGQMMHYAAYKGARAASVYETDGAIQEVEAMTPQTEVLGMDQKEFFIRRSFQKLRYPMIAHAPVRFSLTGVGLDLSSQTKQDEEFKLPLMDNAIAFCGNEEKYNLCER